MGAIANPRSGGVELAYAEITAAFTQTGVGNSDITGLSITPTVGARPIKLLFVCGALKNSDANGITILTVMEGATGLQTVTFNSPGANKNIPVAVEARLAPAAGSHTYKVNVNQLVAGNSVLSAAATAPTFLQAVEI